MKGRETGLMEDRSELPEALGYWSTFDTWRCYINLYGKDTWQPPLTHPGWSIFYIYSAFKGCELWVLDSG